MILLRYVYIFLKTYEKFQITVLDFDFGGKNDEITYFENTNFKELLQEILFNMSKKL